MRSAALDQLHDRVSVVARAVEALLCALANNAPFGVIERDVEVVAIGAPPLASR